MSQPFKSIASQAWIVDAWTQKPLSSTRTKGIIFRGTTLFGKRENLSRVVLSAHSCDNGRSRAGLGYRIWPTDSQATFDGWLLRGLAADDPLLCQAGYARSPGPVRLLLLFTVVFVLVGAFDTLGASLPRTDQRLA